MKVIAFLNAIIALSTPVFAEVCFVVQEKDQIIISEGDAGKRFAPMSTFKIPLSLMGFDAGILEDETHPVWPFKEGYVAWREAWKQDQTPKSWMKESCVWYSQILTQQLGMEKFQDYVTKFSYGNQDLSGDIGQNNGLTQAWLSSSLRISSLEQISFLERMLEGKLPVKPCAITMTKNILVGWIEKGNRRLIFSHHIEDEKKEEMGASLRAKADAKERLKSIIETIETK